MIGFVGRQKVNKGAETLVRAMCKVRTVRAEVPLLMAGPLMLKLMEVETQRIVFIDQFSRRKAAFYDAMDVFASPSTGESFGIGYL